MAHHPRRTFLKLSGGVIGGVFAGSTVVAAERTDRFIAETKGRRTPRDLDVVHEMPGVKFVVVEGSERAVKKSKAVKGYAPDLEVRLSDPAVNDQSPTVAETDITDDELYPLQWDKQSQNVPEAHDVTAGEGTRVSIIDSGVFAAHPDLEVNERLSRNFTDDGEGAGVPAGGDHGTHVAGIVGASDNQIGVGGTAPKTELVDCRVFSYVPGASFADILAAVVYSANVDADVANLSLGAYPVSRRGNGQFYGKVLNSTMTYANKEGTLLVVAAGNDAADLQHDKYLISLPNEGAQACSVAATGPVGFMWDASGYGGEEPAESPAVYTNYGTNAITVAAPGGNYSPAAYEEANDGDDVTPPWFYDLVFNTTADVEYEYETVEDGDDEDDDPDRVPVDYLGAEPTYGWKAGTSMAAPQVAGAAALVKAANPSYNANQVENALRRTATVPDGYDKAYYGAGVINPLDAVTE